MESQDQHITCQDCGQTFTFTVEEQDFYQERDFSAPKRCRPCRSKRKADRPSRAPGARREPRQLYDTVCAACGEPTQVPFEPTSDRPVYCRPCFDARKT